MTPAAIRKKVESFFDRYAATYMRALADKPAYVATDERAIMKKHGLL